MSDKMVFPKHYLLASDFDQTLSFKDSGIVLSELLGTSGFQEKVAGLSRINLIQQGGAYLNNQPVTDVNLSVNESALENGAILLRQGKKKYHRVVVA